MRDRHASLLTMMVFLAGPKIASPLRGRSRTSNFVEMSGLLMRKNTLRVAFFLIPLTGLAMLIDLPSKGEVTLPTRKQLNNIVMKVFQKQKSRQTLRASGFSQ